jgi:transposase
VLSTSSTSARGARLKRFATSTVVNDVNPVDYLADVLLRVQTHPASRIEELLPHRWTPRAAPDSS